MSGRAGQRNTERCLCICHRKWLVLHTVSRHHTRQTQVNSKFSFLKNNFTYLFLAVLGLLATARAFSSCGKRGLFLVVVRGLLTLVASLAEEHGL